MTFKRGMNLSRRLGALALAVITLALWHGAARAQSAADGFAPNIIGLVRAVAVQADGKIVIGGLFSSVNGQPRGNLARLNVDGSLDTAFNASTDGTVFSLCLQTDKIVVGGSFSTLGGQARSNLGRLNTDGTLDAAFNVGASAAVYSLKAQDDFQVVAGGAFTTLGGQPHSHLGRISLAGALDAGFNPAVAGSVFDIELQGDDRLVIGGLFPTVNNQPHSNLARLNADGTLDTSFNPGTGNSVNALALQLDGRILVGGDFTAINNQARNHLGRLNADGSLDAAFNPNVDSFVNAIALRPDGRIFIGGSFTGVAGTSVGRIAPLNPNGSLGPLLGGTNSTVYALAVQSDGKLLAGGQFTAVSGITRNRLARYNTDSTLDDDFNAPALIKRVTAAALQPDSKLVVAASLDIGMNNQTLLRINQNGTLDPAFSATADSYSIASAVQSDGKVVIGGLFNTVNGEAHTCIARLNANGSVDNSVSLQLSDPTGLFHIVAVNAVALQADGKIVIGGDFTKADGQVHPYLARLNANGSLDNTFAPVADDLVYTLAIQPDGKILVGGFFLTMNGQPRARLARLNSDGTLDAGFNPGASDLVTALAVQPDGKVLVGGSFHALGGQPRNLLGRLNANGTLDTGFNPGADGSGVEGFSLQTDGKIVVSGGILALGGQARSGLGRLNANGTIDTSFNPGVDATPSTLILPDGKILVYGLFTTLGGLPRAGLGRLSATSTAAQYMVLSNNNTTLKWGRSGASPEITRATAELSTNGVNYTPLGAGTRGAFSTWNFDNLSLPTGQIFYLRARGYYASGKYNGSDSIVESVRQFYLPAAAPCTFALNPTGQNFAAAGGSGNVALTASQASCAWTIQSNQAWITPAIFSGNGSAGIGYVVAANNGGGRTGTITIAGQTFTVTQDAFGCSYTVAPQSFNVAAGNGNGSVNVTTTAACAWTAVSNAPWLTATTPNGNGSGPAGFTVAANNGAQRTGTLTIAGQTVTVTQDGIVASPTGLQFYPLPKPLRLLDTRAGFTGCDAPGAQITGNSSRTQLARRTCDGITIPADAMAITGNITTVQSGGGYLTLYPSDAAQPLVANSNYAVNEIINNVFTVGLGKADGSFKVFVTTNTDVVVDITGYYAPPGAGGLYFHPLPKPIRLLETRAGFNGAFTPGAKLQANADMPQQARVTYDGVTIPATALAIVGNATTINGGAGYLTLYPGGVPRPLAASSNFGAGQAMNAPFTVGLSATGEFDIFTTTGIDVIVDVLGYYSADASDANGAGLLFNPLPAPVRLLETRVGFTGCDTPNAPLLLGSTRQQQARGACGGQTIAANALAIVGNATVINNQAGYLTFYPNGATQPLVASSNFAAGQVLNRHFTVGLGATGMFNIFTSAQTDLIVDVSGFFAP